MTRTMSTIKWPEQCQQSNDQNNVNNQMTRTMSTIKWPEQCQQSNDQNNVNNKMIRTMSTIKWPEQCQQSNDQNNINNQMTRTMCKIYSNLTNKALEGRLGSLVKNRSRLYSKISSLQQLRAQLNLSKNIFLNFMKTSE